jgi:hypothetical protein
MEIFDATPSQRDLPVIDWGPPVTEPSSSAVEAPKRSYPWRVVSTVAAVVVLAVFLAAVAIAWL